MFNEILLLCNNCKDDINVLERPNIYKSDKISQVSAIFISSKARETKLDKKNQMTQVRLSRTKLDAWLELIKKLRWLIRWRGLKWITMETDVKNTRSSLHARISLLWSSTRVCREISSNFHDLSRVQKVWLFQNNSSVFCARGANTKPEPGWICVGCFMTLIWRMKGFVTITGQDQKWN